MRPNPAETQSLLSRQQIYNNFGGYADEGKVAYLRNVRSQRQRLNVVPICQNLIIPWLLFCLMFAVTSFGVHYFMPTLCYLVVVCCALVVIMCGLFALRNAMMKNQPVDPPEPNWITFLFITMLVAWIMGLVLGDLNFRTNLRSYFDYDNLNEYVAVDPSVTPGQQLMDAGKINFVNTTALDLRRSMGFKNLDTYCVAPISMRLSTGVMPALDFYDFWAVGLNCCSGNTADFHCGQFLNPAIHGGLRLLRDDQRAFFRLAVQQAEAAYNIKAVHPLFFFWTTDPVAEMETYRSEGYKYYMIGILVHFAWQLLCVGLAVLGFSKLGRY